MLAAAAALDYAGPDPTARSLRRGSTGVIGVVTEDSLAESFRDPMNLALLDGIGEGLGDERLGLLVIPRVSDPGIDLAAAPVDAAILLGCSTDVAPSVAALRQRRIPVVAIEAVPMQDVVAIDLDNRDASRRGAEHLRSLGHRRVARRHAAARRGAHPRRGHRRAARRIRRAHHARTPGRRARGVPGCRRPLRVRQHGRRGRPDRAPAARRAGRPSGPTAIVAQSDLLAVGVIRAAEQLGLEVPRDLSVLGFDGVRLEGATAHVLTTLVQPAVEKGRAAAAAVLAELAGERGRAVLLRSELRIGTTTGPGPGSR